MTDDWTDLVVGARMSVDQQFADRVQASGLSRPQWGLVMTAVEFEFEHADDPEAARIVADTSSLEHVLPEMDNVDQQMGPGGGAAGGASGGSSGVVGGIKDALGIGGGGDDDHEELATESRELAQAYADELQAFLEDEGRFEEVRQAAAGGQSADTE
jgi:hypothetical protein